MKKNAAEDQTDKKQPVDLKMMEDGHPDPTRMGFWAMSDKISELDLWDHYCIYGYRLKPEHTPEQKPANAFKLSQPFTMADLARQFGGYRWNLKLKRTNGGEDQKPVETTCDVAASPIPQSHEEFVVPLARAAAPGAQGGAGNEQLVGLVTTMVEKLDKARADAESAGRAFDPAEALNKTITLMETGYKRAIETTEANRGGTDMVGLIREFLPTIKEMITPKQDPLTQELIKRFIAGDDKPRASAEENSVSSVLGIIRALKEELPGLVGKGSAAARADWPSVGMTIAEKLPDLLQYGASMLENAAKLRMSGAAPVNGAPQQPQIQQRPVLVQRPAAPVAVNPAAVESIPTAPGELSPEQVKQAEAMMLEIYAARAKEIMVQALLDGPAPGDESNTGAEVAAIAISVMHPPYAMLLCQQLELAMTGNQQQMTAFREDRILGQLFTNPKVSLTMVMAFAKDFCETIHDRAEEESARVNKIPNPPPAAAPESAPAGEASA